MNKRQNNKKSSNKKMEANKRNANKKSANSKQSIDKMKYEIANEFGVNLGPESSARANGKVGGEITKRLISNGMDRKRNKK